LLTAKKGVLYELKKNKLMFLMLLPAIIYFFILAYIPMVGAVMAFQDFQYSKVFLSPFVGFKNFEFFFKSGSAFLVTKNTILYNVVMFATNTVLQLIVAIVFSELVGKAVKKTAQSIIFLPYFISWVIIGAFIYNIFNYEHGVLNSILSSLGMKPVDVYGTPSVWKYILVVVSSWKWVGYGSVIYLAAIMGIDSEYYDAADIDGANVFQKIRHITLPALKPTIITMTLLALGTIVRGDFEMFYQVTGNAPNLYNSTDIIDTFVFRSLTGSYDIGMSSAVGLYQSAVCFVMILLSNYAIRKIEKDYALF
jgi:putative aldouronate transport system permease protein